MKVLVLCALLSFASADRRPPSNGYGAPPSAPSNGYGAPPSAPRNGYGAPPSVPSNGNGARPSDSNNGYGAPPSAPNNGYGAPPSAPRNGYGAPPSAPSNGYGAPPSNAYGPLRNSYYEVDPLAALAENIPGGGIPGEDYPVLASVPDTGFECNAQNVPGYYADTDQEAGCQVFYICQDRPNGRRQQDSFLCPNGTIFNQQYLVCDWWYNFDCADAEDFYSVNELIGVIPYGYGKSNGNGNNGYNSNGNGNGYGVNGNGGVVSPNDIYGPPAAPSNGYGAPAAPSNGYGAPAAPSNGYGAPSAPSNGYGAPF